MTKTIYIWGCSDDLIEITGDVEEEFYGETGYVVLSHGTMIKASYDERRDGAWTICVDVEGAATCERYPAGTPEALAHTRGRDYSDVVKVTSDFEWVAMASGIRYV